MNKNFNDDDMVVEAQWSYSTFTSSRLTDIRACIKLYNYLRPLESARAAHAVVAFMEACTHKISIRS